MHMYDAMKVYCVKDGKRDAEEFLRLFLDALDEELVESYAYISMRKPASARNSRRLYQWRARLRWESETTWCAEYSFYLNWP